jgi:hypothetical protein
MKAFVVHADSLCFAQNSGTKQSNLNLNWK